MKFRALLTAFWTLVLLWQLTRVFGEEAAWLSLAVPVTAVSGTILLFVRGETGYRLLFFPVLAAAFPFVVMGLFSVGAWMSGAPVPALPSLAPSPFYWRFSFAVLAVFLLVHWMAWVEIMDSPGDDVMEK